MKITGKVEVKELNRFDIDNIIEAVASAIIFENSDGEVIYRPQAMTYMMKCAILGFAVDGIEFEDDDDFLDILEKDKIIGKVIDDFIDQNSEIDSIYHYIYDIVEFRKDLLIHRDTRLTKVLIDASLKENVLNEALTEVANSQNKKLLQEIADNEKQEYLYSQMSNEELLALQKKFANGEMDFNGMIDKVVSKFMDADKTRDMKYKDIIDHKNATITELQAYKDTYEGVMEDDGK